MTEVQSAQLEIYARQYMKIRPQHACIVVYLILNPEPISITELSIKVGLCYNTCRTYVRFMQSEGWLDYNEDNRAVTLNVFSDIKV